MKRIILSCPLLLILLLIGLIGCRGNGAESSKAKEDRAAKELLWGTWLKDDDGSVAFTAKGDTIYNQDPLVLPVSFYICDDSLILESTTRMSYKIVKQSAHLFRILNQNNEEIRYVKQDSSTEDSSEDNGSENDSEVSTPEPPAASALPNVQEAIAANPVSSVSENVYEDENSGNDSHVDTLINYNTKNYRCIIDKRRSHEKVIRTSYNEDGIGVDKVYFDNTISLKVYVGQTLLLTKNFRKSDFAKYVDPGVFKQSILRDIEYVGTTDNGVQCQAVIAHPDSPAGFTVNIDIPARGGYKISKAE